jgi:DNA polymerase III subunit gamma/tau
MLGLADRGRIVDLFDALMRGDVAAAMQELRDQYDSGADPAIVIADLAEFTHFVTRVKIVPAAADDRSLAETERVRGRAFAATLSMRVLSRTWQMLLKGLPEVQTAGKPIAAAEMVLVRIAYVADLPTPDEAIRMLSETPVDGPRPTPGNGGSAVAYAAPRNEIQRGGSRLAPSASVAIDPVARRDTPAPLTIARFEDLVALAGEKRDLALKTALERDLRLVRFEDGKLEVALEPSGSRTLVGDLSRKLSEWTGRRWIVVVSTEPGQPSIKTQNEARRAEMLTGIRADPLVQAVLTRFPGAEIVAVREREADLAAAGALPPAEPDEGASEPTPEDDSPAFGARRQPDDVDDDF